MNKTSCNKRLNVRVLSKQITVPVQNSYLELLTFGCEKSAGPTSVTPGVRSVMFRNSLRASSYNKLLYFIKKTIRNLYNNRTKNIRLCSELQSIYVPNMLNYDW